MKVTEDQREEFFNITGHYGSDAEVYKVFNPSEFADEPKTEDPLAIQVGGSHYSAQKIQPVEYIFQNNLGFCEGNVVKYVTRYKEKNGIQDLEKARHYLDLLINQLSKENK